MISASDPADNGFLKGCFIFILLSVSAIAGSSSDTTYGDYRVKEKESGRRPDNTSQNNGNNACENGSDTGSGCFSGCSSTCFDFGVDLISEIFKRIGHAIDEGHSASPCGVDFSLFSKCWFRYGLGMGAGVLDYPRIATGFQPEAIAHFYFIPSSHICFRANTGLDFSINSIHINFERDVFVDTGTIGTATVRPESYQNVSIPLSAEIMVRPFGDFGSFHLIAGGGCAGVAEHIKGEQTATFDTKPKEVTSTAFHLQPLISFGIGWLLVAGERLGNLEIRYCKSLLNDRHKKPLPGDNAPYSNSFSIEYTWLF